MGEHEQEIPAESVLTSSTLPRLRLAGLVFAVGAASLTAQSLLVREFLVVCFGNELSLGVVFASWLIGVATGGAVGGWLSRSPERARRTLLGGALGAGLVLPIQLGLIRASRVLAGVPTGELVPLGRLLALALLLGAPGSFCLGLTFAPACALLAGAAGGQREATAIGRVYVLEALGALVGGSFFSLVLAGRVATFTVAAGLGAVLVSLGAMVALRHRRPGGSWLLVLLLVTGLLLAAWPLERWSRDVRWRALQPGVELVASVDSRYQNLALAQLADQYSIYGNGEVMGTFPDPYTVAQEAHLFMVQHPSPRRVLLVGGGIEGLVAELLKYPVTQLDYVSLDRKVPALIRPYLPRELRGVFDDARFHQYYADGRYFVKQATGPYDLILTELPDPRSAMVNRFYTREFFDEVSQILGPDGVLVTHAGETASYVGEEMGRYAGSVYRTLKTVFPEVVATPGGTTYFFAGRMPGIVSADPKLLAERFQASGVQSAYFVPELYAQLLPPQWVEFINAELRARTDVPLNTDLRPVTYFFGLVLWDRYSGSRLTPVLEWLQGLRMSWLLLLAGVVAMLVVLYQLLRRGRHQRRLRANVTWTVMTTGCAAMAIELVLVFAFQNSFGYVYEKVGLIIGVFMFGRAGGGWAPTRVVARQSKLRLGPLLGVNAGLVLFTGATPTLLRGVSLAGYRTQEAGFLLLVCASGFLTGAVFPLAAHLVRQTSREVSRTAGRLEWADHIGACAGALVTGVVLVPVAGLAGACYVVSALVGSSLLLLLVSAWRGRGRSGGEH